MDFIIKLKIIFLSAVIVTAALSAAARSEMLPPQVQFPQAGTIMRISNPSLKWTTVDGAHRYFVQIAKDQDFSVVVQENSDILTPEYQSLYLADGIYYFRVCALDTAGARGYFSKPVSFSVSKGLQDFELSSPYDGEITASDNIAFTGRAATGNLILIGKEPVLQDMAGSFIKNKRVNEGINLVRIRSEDAWNRTVIYDNLVWVYRAGNAERSLMDRNGLWINSDKLRVSGHISEDENIFINDEPVQDDGGDYFDFLARLREGENSFKINIRRKGYDSSVIEKHIRVYSDRTPPVLKSVRLYPNEIEAGKKIRVMIKAEDETGDLSKKALFSMFRTEGDESFYLEGIAELISPEEGYNGFVLVPAEAAGGKITLSNVTIEDALGNSSEQNSNLSVTIKEKKTAKKFIDEPVFLIIMGLLIVVTVL